jgi:hypothetical protein
MSNLFAEIKNKATGQKPMPEIFEDPDFKTIKFYLELPPNTRVATIEDFTDHSGNLVNDKHYLIHSQKNPGKYWAQRSRQGFTKHNDFLLFLKRGRVYIFV